jgi:hypothetical protein
LDLLPERHHFLLYFFLGTALKWFSFAAQVLATDVRGIEYRISLLVINGQVPGTP